MQELLSDIIYPPMPVTHPFNQDLVAELADENVVLQALLSAATGVWFSSEDDDLEPEAVD